MPALSGSYGSQKAKPKAKPLPKAPTAKGVSGGVSAAKVSPKPTYKAPPLKKFPKQLEGGPKLQKAFHKRQVEHPAEKPAKSLLTKVEELPAKAFHATYGEHVSGKSGKKPSVAPGAAIATTVPKELSEHAAKDVVSMGELPFVAGLQVGKAGVSAAKGNLKPAKEFAKTTAESLKHGALGELAQGHIEGANKAFKAHPAISLFEVAGLKGVAGHTTGAVTRAVGSDVTATGVRGAAARAGSTVRPAVAHVDDSGAVRAGAYTQRTYSKDAIRKAGQVAADKRREVVLDATNKPVMIKDRGRVVPVLKAKSVKEQAKLQSERANFESSTNQAMEILNRDRVSKGLSKIEKPKHIEFAHIRGAGKELHQLVASGTLRTVATFKEDLQKRIATIEKALKNPEQYRNTEELKAAQKNLAVLKKAAKDPKIHENAEAIVERGLAAAKLLNEGDKRLADLNIHPLAELERAALSEYALAHMDARHGAPTGELGYQTSTRPQPPGEVALHELHGSKDEALRNAHEPKALTKENAEAQAQIIRARGNPDAKITIYRATKGDGINPEDWVSISPTYAKSVLARRPGSKVIKAEVRAKDLRMGKGTGLAEQKYVGPAIEHGARAAKPEEVRTGLIGPDGHLLTNEEIRAHAEAAGRDPSTLAYVPHTVGAGSKGAFHRPFRPGARPVAAGKTRTGVAYLRGQNAIGREILREEATRKATKANMAESLDQFARESGVKRPDGREFTPSEGMETAARLNADGRTQYIPMRVFGASQPVDMQKAIAEGQSVRSMETAHEAMLNDRIVSASDVGSQTRNVVLVPAHQVNTLMRQVRPAGELEALAQLMNNPFRMAVLPQPKWLTGNFLEPYVIRGTFSGAGLNIPGLYVDVRKASKGIKEMEASTNPTLKRAADQLRSMQLGGLFVGRKGASVRRTYEDFPEGELRRKLYALHVARNTPAVKQMGDMVLSIPHAFFHVNRVIEGGAQRMALGKSMRMDIQQITGSWLKTIMTGKEAMEEVQKGLVDTATQHRFMKEQHEMLGQYNAFNPTMRKAVQTLFPFLPWTLNSLRFVYWTLPVHHTVAFTALMKASQGVQQEWEAEHEGVPPGTLKDAVVRKDKGLVDIAKYTPYGATIPFAHDVAEGAEGLTNAFAPQVSGAMKAIGGQDPFGRPLQVPKTKTNPRGQPKGGEKAAIAANELAEATVPLLGIGRRILEGGGTPYAPTGIGVPKTKAGTKHVSGLDRALNPFRPTYLKNPKGKKGLEKEQLEREPLEKAGLEKER